MNTQKNATTPIYRCAICGFYVDKPIHCSVSATPLMNSEDRLKLSKLMSGILRHYRHVAGLCLDNEGYTAISDLLRVIKTWKYGGFNWVATDHILAILRLDPRGRFEVVGDKIRAVYGHSYAVALRYPPSA